MKQQKNYTINSFNEPKKLNRSCLLDNKSKSRRWSSNKEKVKARFWQRIQSFISKMKSQRIKGYRFAFLTLTSSIESDNKYILNHWEILRKRINRKYGKIWYFAVRETNEKGDLIHLHILLYAPYINVNWISTQWNDIHNAKVVYIEGIPDSEIQSKILGYMSKYISKGMSEESEANKERYQLTVKRYKLIVKRYTYSIFFPSVALAWEYFKNYYIYLYGHDINDTVKHWTKFIVEVKTWDYSTIIQYLMGI